MNLFGDYHIHSVYSNKKHADGTIEQIAKFAKQKGLKEVAITDHGFSHKLYGMKKKNWEKYFEDIEKARLDNPGLQIFTGLETNIISVDGTIDLSQDEYQKVDIVLCGFHYFAKPKTMLDKIKFFNKNLFGIFFGVSKKTIEMNTKAIINAIEKNRIDVLVHLNYGMKVNTLEVAKVARDKGVYIELNGRNMRFTDQELLDMAKEGVRFIVSSDAHTPSKIGACCKVLNTIMRLNIPLELISNIDKFPQFKKDRREL